MIEFKIVSKDQDALNKEWDEIAILRDKHISSGQDNSYSKILSRKILELSIDKRNVLDIGSGTGHLAMMVKNSFENIRVTGVEPSKKSIEIASAKYQDIDFYCSTAETFAESSQEEFDFIYSNMVLMDVLNLQNFSDAVFKLSSTKNTAHILTHPAFWPRYWGYDKIKDFNYMEEMAIESNFKTKNKIYPFKTTHIHRPIQSYTDAFLKSGFNNIKITELRGPEPVDEFAYPRFIVIETFDSEPNVKQ